MTSRLIMTTRFQKRGAVMILSLIRLTIGWSIQSEASMILPFNSLMLDSGRTHYLYGGQA